MKEHDVIVYIEDGAVSSVKSRRGLTVMVVDHDDLEGPRRTLWIGGRPYQPSDGRPLPQPS